MRKDLKSYEKHNSQYLEEINSYESTIKIIEKYDSINQFKVLGFELSIKLTRDLPAIAIDIGSGTGWLVKKLSPIFKKVIAVEPSSAALDVSRKVNQSSDNVLYVNKDMLDAINELDIKEPVFITTSTVLNHIESNYVAEFLKTINNLPSASVLFFDERYDKNTNWNMWHVRNKDWWRSNLPSWQLIFLDIENSGYPTGIYGIRTDNKIKNYKSSMLEKFIWKISYVFYFTQRMFKKICRTIIK
jgi:SAM-dependent methyltransferase